MSEPENLLSDVGVWDDSALIESWNDALEEYKKYHSIHAKRGHLKEIVPKPSTAPVDANVMDAPKDGAQDDAQDDATAAVPTSSSQHMPPPQSLPQTMIGSIRDENLKKLLMSWYYAGYYTGLHEGQQQGREEAKTTENKAQS